MKILITGARGLLGSNLALMYSENNAVYATGKNKPTFDFCENYEIDITSDEDVRKIEELKPDVVVHCAALTNVDYCEENIWEAVKLNAEGTEKISEACRKIGSYLVHISTDQVFDGLIGDYSEESPSNPINVYGKTKLDAEKIIQKTNRNFCILRTNIYGWNMQDKSSLAEWILAKLEKKEEVSGFKDIFFNPINTTNLGRCILELIDKGYQGVLHLAGSEKISKYEFARKVAKIFGYDETLIRPISSDEVNFKARRPKKMTLNIEKAKNLLENKLKNVVEGLEEFKNLRDSGFLEELKKQNIGIIEKVNKSFKFSEDMEISILGRKIGQNEPTYFIADIAANHDGSLERAKHLIKAAKEAGADAVKFQHHRVKHYVSEIGFESLGNKLSHQSKWKKSIFEVYKDAVVPLEWTSDLKKYADSVGIHLFTTPYDLGMVDLVDPYFPAFKIGSGDINWPDMLEKVSRKGKPVFVATGASNIGEVQMAMEILTKNNKEVVLMQCNTNYTADDSNFDHIHLNVLKTYKKMFPKTILGLSDHTKGHATVLGAVALGARVIEKHFTDDTSREGPDHPFSMDIKTWREMVDRTRELERALGDGNKKVEDNEKETVILQRRCIRASRDIFEGKIITEDDLEFQRPASEGSLEPLFKAKVLGKKAKRNIFKEEQIDFSKIE
ncbi:MAG: N-acetylneuraminate synthase family protein [Nanoarchaeota archaeon]